MSDWLDDDKHDAVFAKLPPEVTQERAPGFYWVKEPPSSGGAWIVAEWSSDYDCFHECGLDDYFEPDAYARIGPRINPPKDPK